MRAKNKPLWKISVITNREAEEAVAELLQSLVTEPAVAYTDFETGEVTVTSYLSAKPEWPRLHKELLARLARLKSCDLKIGSGKISFHKVRHEDWAESWKRHFKPLEIGPALLIKPSWSQRQPKLDQTVVILDPGLSFGTGQHPTTSFCLRQLVASRFSNAQKLKPSFLDIGTGSGILAIAAAKMGFAPIEAFDFDLEAVRVARDNARKNRVAQKIRLYQADLTKLPRHSPKKFDVICANLISPLLISECRRILDRLKSGGVLIIAGILANEFAEVQNVYEQAGLKLKSARTEKEWRSGMFVVRV